MMITVLQYRLIFQRNRYVIFGEG
uniref:Uncharacterized protein n=1 Tax=Arundo donax TaxID=35708 RepID=A0A0A9FQV4_ARUDO